MHAGKVSKTCAAKLNNTRPVVDQEIAVRRTRDERRYARAGADSRCSRRPPWPAWVPSAIAEPSAVAVPWTEDHYPVKCSEIWDLEELTGLRTQAQRRRGGEAPMSSPPTILPGLVRDRSLTDPSLGQEPIHRTDVPHRKRCTRIASASNRAGSNPGHSDMRVSVATHTARFPSTNPATTSLLVPERERYRAGKKTSWHLGWSLPSTALIARSFRVSRDGAVTSSG